ncbi:MAG: hypothetical protein EOO92_07455 [Pedobacter sp.]|nr:MAG: hypothetical protein EOO92_07455 [Pedobacter sp.]
MENALQFVANMKQLSMAIDLDARQDCAYQLSNWKGLQWVLNCTFKRGIVGLEMWFQNQGFDEPLNTVFDWRGKADEFRDAVNFMITKMGRYKFFK